MLPSPTLHLRLFLRISLVLLLALGVMSVSAQPLTPIAIGDSITGSLTASEPIVRYAFQLENPTQVDVRIFAVSGGLIPSLRLIGPTGTTLATALNPTGDDQVEVEAGVGRGIHQIIVEGVNGTTGQFLLLVESGAPAVPPSPLIEGQTVAAAVDATNALRVYSFRVGFEDMLLVVNSDLPLSGPVVTLKDALTGETLGMTTARLTGARFTIPAGQIDYLREIGASGGGGREPSSRSPAPKPTAGAARASSSASAASTPTSSRTAVTPI